MEINFDCDKCMDKCKVGCCYLHFFDRDLWIMKRDYATNVKDVFEIKDKFLVMTSDMKCAFFNRNNNACRIYTSRPDICRAYGTKELECPWQTPDGKLRTKEETEIILKKIKEQNEKLRRQVEEYGRQSN